MKALKARILGAVQQDLIDIEHALEANLTPHLPVISHVAKYVMFSGGKRIRPLLMILSARLCGYEGNGDKTLSAAFEYLHAATLIHDDVVDDGEVRRGNPAAHTVWGNSATVLVGDFLLARAISMAARTGRLPIVEVFASTVARMSEGEISQLLYRGDLGLTEGQYMEVIRAKTACLIEAACRVGALLAAASKEKVDRLGSFGDHLGLAFQMVDDLLDYTADPSVLGKATGTDLREGKLTLPFIRAFHGATPRDRERMSRIVEAGLVTEADFAAVVELIEEYGALEDTRRKAQDHIVLAKHCLETFEPSKTRAILEDIADYVLARDL